MTTYTATYKGAERPWYRTATDIGDVFNWSLLYPRGMSDYVRRFWWFAKTSERITITCPDFPLGQIKIGREPINPGGTPCLFTLGASNPGSIPYMTTYYTYLGVLQRIQDIFAEWASHAE